MGEIALTELMSLDGVMQSPGHADVPFKYRGWAVDFDAGPEADRPSAVGQKACIAS